MLLELRECIPVEKEERIMKKTVKVAVAVLIVGVVVMLAGFAMAGFDLNALASGGALVSRQYEAEGDDHLLSSPGAADIGGLFITPLEKDFKKINPELLRDVYQQVCLSDRDVEEIFVHLSSN